MIQKGYADNSLKTIDVKIKNKIYTFELADTQLEKQIGLMFRQELAEDSGMLFVFYKMDYLSFYMKNTIIPLDIAFMDNEFNIIDIQSMEPLDTTLTISKSKAQYALEVNKGFFRRVGLGVGDRIEFITPLKANPGNIQYPPIESF